MPKKTTQKLPAPITFQMTITPRKNDFKIVYEGDDPRTTKVCEWVCDAIEDALNGR